MPRKATSTGPADQQPAKPIRTSPPGQARPPERSKRWIVAYSIQGNLAHSTSEHCSFSIIGRVTTRT
jgi:hypothetical protein